MARVYTLYRVSTVGQVDHDDIPMQRIACREFVQAQAGWEIVKEFYEKGVSGYKVKTENRDAIMEIKADALAGKFDILLVFMFDRLGRRDDETPFVVQWFVSHGIRVWSVKEGEQRFDSHVDKLLNYIRFWQASGESEKTAIRVRAKQQQMVLAGEYLSDVGSHLKPQLLRDLFRGEAGCFCFFHDGAHGDGMEDLLLLRFQSLDLLLLFCDLRIDQRDAFFGGTSSHSGHILSKL